MELAKVTAKGQITIPIGIRRKLGIFEGGKVLFFEDPESGRIYMDNASMDAIHEARAAFAGEAGRLGLNDEQDIVDMVKEIRAEKKARA